ncbi:hypothetical protein HGP16_30020 [Rhizobium sp. P40RR-XXII]|uniref:hypothetical protein n=1 Tax=Rhizobium sp. P40RR-XXII TaxID=2726739 RepID=UPI0014578E80|nr:hypothetical protein [Rhizobium sp. P40RR-XXII]NLS20747.1 hypothetical protein [Rhizobium sp. P40RR-XXII]
MRFFFVAGILMLTAGTALAGLSEDITTCKTEPDSLKRLTCFDAIKVGEAQSSRPTDQPKAAAPITLVNARLLLQEKDLRKRIYSPRVELIPSFRNGTKKTVVAIEHTMAITDAFGDEIIEGKSKLDIKIPPGKTIESELFYSWEDNQFIQDEPFDKLLGPVKTGVARATLIVTKAVFSDGTTETYQEL